MRAVNEVHERNTYVFMLNMLEELELTVCTLAKDGSTEGLHDLLDRDRRARQLILGGADASGRSWKGERWVEG